MTDRATLLALAERVEAATSGCRKLDAEICSRLFGRSIGVSRYTFNIDAALSLVPTDWEWEMQGCEGTLLYSELDTQMVYTAELGDPLLYIAATAATPALALTAASLRAIAWSMTDD